MAQGIAEETLSVAGLAAVRRADAAAAMARAELEIARRGLVATVTGLFYGSLAADHKAGIAQRACQEAKNFTTITQDREKQGEAAHADVIKAQLTEQEQWRLAEGCAAGRANRAADLGVLLFSDPRTTYTLQAAASCASAGRHCRCGSGGRQVQSGDEERAGESRCDQCRRARSACGADAHARIST